MTTAITYSGWPERDGRGLHVALEPLAHADLHTWVVERNLPAMFGFGWNVQRVVVPGMIELSWGQAYRRLSSPRVTRWLSDGHTLTSLPHPIG